MERELTSAQYHAAVTRLWEALGNPRFPDETQGRDVFTMCVDTLHAQQRQLAELRTTITRLESDRDSWRARAEAAEAVVEKLPKTADGVPVIVGEQVFHPFAESRDDWFVGGDRCPRCNPWVAGNDDEGDDVSSCYSTKEAAQEAAGQTI